MYNAKNILTVTHSIPRNNRITHYQTERGRVGSRCFKGEDCVEQAKAFVTEVHAHGERIIAVRNGIGQAVQL